MHCDIKEANIMVRNKDFTKPEVVIIDLGIATSIKPVNEKKIKGTPGYIPPETWKEQGWFPKGDIFSMGVVCMQLLTDKTPNASDKGPPKGLFVEGCSTQTMVMNTTMSRKPPYDLIQPQSAGL